MKTAPNNRRPSKPRKFFLTALFGVAALSCSFALWNLGVFCDHLDRLSFAIKKSDAQGAGKELEETEKFYAAAQKLRLGWALNLLPDNRLHLASYLYLIGDYEGVEKTVNKNSRDHRVFRLLGSAKFRFAKALYLSGRKKDGLNFALNEAAQEFEKAVRLGPADNFDDKWNYDLLSDEKTAKKALEQKGPVPKIMLGEKSETPGGELKQKEIPQEGDGQKFDEKKQGQSGKEKRRG